MTTWALSTVKMPAYKPQTQAAPAPVQEPAAVASAKPTGKPVEQVTAQAVNAAAEQIESFLKDSNRQLEFRLDEGSGQMVVTVRDAATGDVIRQIPGEEVLRMARALKEGSALLADVLV